MLTALTGLAAGSVHVISGPDHLAALAPLAVENRAHATRVGLTWGLGHGLGVVLLGTLGVALRDHIDVAKVSEVSERLVGFLLVAIGAWAIFKARELVLHTHEHDHLRGDGPKGHAHYHVHDGDQQHSAVSGHHAHIHGALGVGLLHGMAGSGHVFGVLPSLALPAVDAAVYLGCYLLAAVLSMGGFALALGLLARRNGGAAMRPLMASAGFAALGLGGYWLTVH